jgi:hypothetical protein
MYGLFFLVFSIGAISAGLFFLLSVWYAGKMLASYDYQHKTRYVGDIRQRLELVTHYYLKELGIRKR